MRREGPTPNEAAEFGLTVGDVAERTGLNPAVLRTWETRFGFPAPHRLPSGHRRYSEADVLQIRQVLRRREAGVRLDTAIADAVNMGSPESPSIFAELRRRYPSITVHRLRKSTLVSLSRAIEDESHAAADGPVLFGAFQRQEFYAASASRWAELSRVASSAIVFADEWPEGDATSRPARARLDETSPMRREWSVVCDAPGFSACLAAWEPAVEKPVRDSERIFEALWTTSPSVVRDAARIAAAAAVASGVAGAQELAQRLTDSPHAWGTDAESTAALFSRVVTYMDRAR